MAVSKRLRYEILRRDNHTCRYCGAHAPDVKLTVDHVTPKALGGSDDPTNLVAACADCNAGKSASSPDAPLVDDVAADAIRWAAAIRQAAAIRLREWADDQALLDRWFDRWELLGMRLYLPPAGSGSVLNTLKNLLAAGLDETDLMHSVKVTANARHVLMENRFKYFCGVCWREVDRRRAIAESLLQVEEAPADGS